MTTEIAINISSQAFDKLRGHNVDTQLLWMARALSQLKPGQRIQIIELADLKPRQKKNLAELIELGLLKPTKHSATKYYVPRALAFASNEPTLDNIAEQT